MAKTKKKSESDNQRIGAAALAAIQKILCEGPDAEAARAPIHLFKHEVMAAFFRLERDTSQKFAEEFIGGIIKKLCP